ncbi:MAG: hypothetical protein IJX27_04695, partial [Clostridia bacterium]|nr:hypothetical protein [Clostridia bacterium]
VEKERWRTCFIAGTLMQVLFSGARNVGASRNSPERAFSAPGNLGYAQIPSRFSSTQEHSKIKKHSLMQVLFGGARNGT